MSTFPGLVLARAAAALALSALVLGGCANRDVKATDAGHPRGDGPAVEVADDAGPDMTADMAMADGHVDVAQSDARDVAVERPTCPPTARFNFETGATYMARVNNCTGAGCPQAFTALANSDVYTFCGTGALEVNASFSGAQGDGAKGEVIIPLGGADGATSEDLTGKTITIHVASLPAGDVKFSLQLITETAGYQNVPTALVRMVSDSWSTSTVTFTGDAGVIGGAAVVALSLEGFSFTGYQGKVYFDEIDIK